MDVADAGWIAVGYLAFSVAWSLILGRWLRGARRMDQRLDRSRL
jgi:hypothetical protein